MRLPATGRSSSSRHLDGSRMHLIAVLVYGSLLSCGQASDEPVVGLRAHATVLASSEWSAPVNLGATVNSSAGDQNATLSPDELSLYFVSTRPGGLGSTDLWVSERACEHCPWGTPLNLGAPLNSTFADAAPRLSADGHLLFFTSDRPGGRGSVDIYMSQRADPKDNFGWGGPVPLGTDVNTASSDAGPNYVQGADGAANLFFVRGAAITALYYAKITRNGETVGPAVLVPELSDPISGPGHPSVRTDGREIFFQSARAGGLGGFDLWTATRRSSNEPWSAPVNLGAPLNGASVDFQPSLSNDGRTLIFSSNRPGGLGGQDLWISTRTPSNREQ